MTDRRNKINRDRINLPIGLFDSGMGGLTVLKAINACLPAEDVIYLGDTARLPYGTKGKETIVRYTLQAVGKLVDMGVKMLVIACNTATSAALPVLRERFAPLPVLGVVEPGAMAAARASRNGVIVVIATEATISSGVYQEAITRIRPDARVIGRACTLFVPLAEEGWMKGPVVEGAAKRYLKDIFNPVVTAPRPDTLLLGCTHFPLLLPALRHVTGNSASIVDSAATTAYCAHDELVPLGMARAGRTGTCRFLTTDNRDRFARTGSLFLGRPLKTTDVELVDL
ncbi:MAG: glutamate racemase [Desulfovibrio sp.]|jgi:glutamate racemase|nr:glutamate racemase [Desulfovibrio sp.]